MATLGTASILITADDRALQSVLNSIPNLFVRAGVAAERRAVSAFAAAGAACGRAFTRGVRAESSAMPLAPNPQANQSSYQSAGAASGMAFARGVRTGANSSGSGITPPSTTSAFSVAGTASGNAFASSVAVGAIGIGGSLTNPVQNVTQAYRAAGTNSGNAFGAAIASNTSSIGASLINPIASVAQAYQAAGTVGGGAFSTAAARATTGIGAAMAAPVAATTAAFTSAGNIGGLNFTRGVSAGIAGIAASVVNPIASTTQAYSVAGIASGRTFSAGIAAGSSGITASITNPIQSIAQSFSAAGTASGNGFGIGLRSSTAGIGAGIGSQLGSATTPALSAGEQAGRAFARGFAATARAAAAVPTGIFNAGRNAGNNLRNNVVDSIGQRLSYGAANTVMGGIGALFDTENYGKADAASRKVATLALKERLDYQTDARRISKELGYGVSSTELQSGAQYQALSSGYNKRDDVNAISKVAGKLSIISGGEARLENTAAAINALGSILQKAGFDGKGTKPLNVPKDANKLGSLVSGFVDASVRFDEALTARQIGKLVQPGVRSKLDPYEALGASAQVSKTLTPGATVAGFGQTIKSIEAPQKKAIEAAELLDFDLSPQALTDKGFLNFIEGLKGKLDAFEQKNGTGAKNAVFTNLFPSSQARNYVGAVVDKVPDARAATQTIRDASVDDKLKVVQEGTIARNQAFKNSLIELDLQIKSGAVGSALSESFSIATKAIEGIAAGLNGLNQAYNTLSPGQKAFIDRIGGLAVAAGAVVAAIAGVGLVVGIIGPPLAAAATLIGGFAIGLGSIALAAAPIVVPIAAVSGAVYGVAKAFGATDSQAFVAALSAAGVAVGLLFGPAIISTVVAGSVAVTSSLAAIAVAGAAAALPFLPFIAIGAAVVGVLALLYAAFTNPAIQKWAQDAGEATGKFFKQFSADVDLWGNEFSKGIELGFAATIDFFKNGWKAIADTSTNWTSSSNVAIASWGKNLGDGTNQAFEATKSFFVSGWNSLAATTTSFVSSASSTLSSWWSSISTGFSNWFNSLNLSSAGSWDGLLNLGKRFTTAFDTTIFDFNKAIIGYFASMGAGVWAQLQKWFPWLKSIGSAVNGLGGQIVGFKDGVVAAFNSTVKAGQSLGAGLSKYFDDVVASIKGMMDWVGQIPAKFSAAADAINFFKDKSKSVESVAPAPSTSSTASPPPNGQPNYGDGAFGKKVPLRSSTASENNTAFDPTAIGVLVASADLNGVFTKPITTAGSEFRSAVGQSAAQLQKAFNVASPISSVVPTAKGAAYYNPPMAIQKPEATRNRRGKIEPHYGLDIPGRVGTPVHAAFDGEATYEKVSYQNNSGRTLTTGGITLKGIDAYGNKISLRYFHLGQETMARAGQKMLVKAGDTIGAIGTDGKQGGNDYHVDLKARVNGVKLKDPRMLLQELVRQSEGSGGKVNAPVSRAGTDNQPVRSTVIVASASKTQPQPKPDPVFKAQFVEPRVSNTVRVGASTYTPGGGGINGPERDVRGNKLTRNDKAVAIPGLANGGIKNTVPYGTIVVVTNPKTGLSSEATVRDAGPFVGATNRQADLTTALAKAIKFEGTGQVDIKIVKLPTGFDPKGTYQLGDTKKFGSDKRSNITPGPSIAGPGITGSDLVGRNTQQSNSDTDLQIGGSVTSVDARKLKDAKARLDRAIADEERIKANQGSDDSGTGERRSKKAFRRRESAKTRLTRAIADEERIKRIGVRKASGKKGTDKGAVQGRMNETYARQLEVASRRRADAQIRLEQSISDEKEGKEIGASQASDKKETYARQLKKAARRREDAQKAYDRARGNAGLETSSSDPDAQRNFAKSQVDALKNQFDVLQNQVTLENAKTDKAASDPKSGITTAIADAAKAKRAQTQFNALTPILKAAQNLRQKYAGNSEITAQINQLETAIYGIGRDANEGKTKVASQPIEAAKLRVNTTINDAGKRDATIENEQKLGVISSDEASDRLKANKTRMAAELAAQIAGIKALKTRAVSKDDLTALDELLSTIDRGKADAIASLREQVQNKYATAIDRQIESGDKQIGDVALARSVGDISTEEEDKRVLDIRIATNNEIQKTIEGLLFMRSIAQNSDDVKIIDGLIRKTNEYYAKTIQARKDFFTSSYNNKFDKIVGVRDKRTTEVNQQAELNFAPTNRDVEQQEKTLLVIRQQSTVELKKLREELEQYRSSLSDADVKTREIVNEQIAKIRAIEIETARATAAADKGAVLLRDTTKSIATVGQESFKSMFLDAQNGFRNVGSIVDNLINKVADIGLNAIFDKVVGGNIGGGGIVGTVLGFLGFDRGGTVPSLGHAGSGAVSIANYAAGGSVGINKTIGKAFGIVGGLQAALKREGAGGVPIVAKVGEEVLDLQNAKLYRSLVASGEWERVRQVNNYAAGGSIGNVSNMPTMTNSARSGGSTTDRGSSTSQRGNITVDRINGIDYVTVEQMAAFVDIKMPQAAQAGAALSERNLSNTNYRQRNGL